MANDVDQVKDSVLCLKDCDAFGFDLDHTIAKYNLPEFWELIYHCLGSHLVDKCGYDKSLLEPLSAWKDFFCRGLILEFETGNFCKLSEDGKVVRASHGTRFMTETEMNEVYGEDRVWPHYLDLLNNVNYASNYRMFENHFDTLSGLVAARCVDIIDEKAGKPQLRYNFWKDLISALNQAFHPKHFSQDIGEYFASMKADHVKYVRECGREVRDWLKELKKQGKTVFVVTTSYPDYAHFVLEHIIGADWKQWFDITVSHAQKPRFFTENNPFYTVDDDYQEFEVTHKLEQGQIYAQGNLPGLVAFLKAQTGKDDPRVVFFGDSLRSDVFPAKNFANWQTVYILEEMTTEGMGKRTNEGIEPVVTLDHSTPSDVEKAYIHSDCWGSYFREETAALVQNEPKNLPGFKHMNTFWGYVVRKYADIAVPTLDYIAKFPMEHQFEVFDHTNETKTGFYPGLPLSLIP